MWVHRRVLRRGREQRTSPPSPPRNHGLRTLSPSSCVRLQVQELDVACGYRGGGSYGCHTFDTAPLAHLPGLRCLTLRGGGARCVCVCARRSASTRAVHPLTTGPMHLIRCCVLRRFRGALPVGPAPLPAPAAPAGRAAQRDAPQPSVLSAPPLCAARLLPVGGRLAEGAGGAALRCGGRRGGAEGCGGSWAGGRRWGGMLSSTCPGPPSPTWPSRPFTNHHPAAAWRLWKLRGTTQSTRRRQGLAMTGGHSRRTTSCRRARAVRHGGEEARRAAAALPFTTALKKVPLDSSWQLRQRAHRRWAAGLPLPPFLPRCSTSTAGGAPKC